MARRQGESFVFDREAIRRQILHILKEAKQYPRVAPYAGRIDKEITYFENFEITEEEIPPLPEALSHLDPEDTYQFLFKNTCRHISLNQLYGFSVAEDADSCTGKAGKFSKESLTSLREFTQLFATSKGAKERRPITFFIEQDAKYVDQTELYLEDLVPDQYHLYKVGSVSGIQASGDTRLDIFGINFDWLSLTGISVAFPMDACDVYLSMKFTGAQYGGDPAQPDAVYLDRAIVVRK